MRDTTLAHPPASGRMGQLIATVREQPLGALGAVVLITMAVLAMGAPWIAPYDPTEGNAALLNAPPSAAHWLGTDPFGRDMLSRLIHGARVSLLVGLGAWVWLHARWPEIGRYAQALHPDPAQEPRP